MLTTDILVKELTTAREKGFIERLTVRINEGQFDIKQLIDLTLHADTQTAFRAAWLLDSVIHTYSEHYINDIDYFINCVGSVTNQSCKRHYARILMHLTAPDAPGRIGNKLYSLDLEIVVEKCFDWIIDPKVKVAVKACAAETLYNLRHRYDWIKEELASQIQFMMKDGSPAIQARGKKLLKELQ